MEYSIQDIIDGAVEQQPTKIQTAFDYIVGQKVMDALEVKKRELATTMFNAPEEQDLSQEIEAQHAEDENIESTEENDQPA